MRSRLVAALLGTALLLAGCGDDAEPGGLHGNVLDPPFAVPTTELTDTSGEAYSLVEDTDKPLTLVFFGYTHCPDICTIVMSNLAAAMTKLDQPDRERVDVVFVTTDPERDDPATLRTYLDRFDPGFIGLTGELDTIVDVGKPLGVGVDHGKKLPSGGYDVTHGTTVTGIDGEDQAPVYWNEDTSAAQYADDIHQLLA